MREVSAGYLEGIKEGRLHFKMLEKPQIKEAAILQIKFCNDVGFWQGSGLHADFVKGLHDFWKNQLDKLE